MTIRKNPYKDFIKLMDKSERVIVSRNTRPYEGNEDNSPETLYTICNGYMALELLEVRYRIYFCSEKPYYKELERDGSNYTSEKKDRKNGKLFSPVGDCDLSKFFPDMEKQQHASYTGLHIDNETDKSYVSPAKELTIFCNAKTVILLNRDYFKPIKSLFLDNGSCKMLSDTDTSPITFYQYGERAIICPVRNREILTDDMKQSIINLYYGENEQ